MLLIAGTGQLLVKNNGNLFANLYDFQIVQHFCQNTILFPGSLILPPPGASGKMRDHGNEAGQNKQN